MYERDCVLSWDNYFMGIAKLTSMKSKDPSTQVGVCIVNDRKIIISTGYNGIVRGVNDSLYNWGREDFGEGSKYDHIIHAELNAILNASGRDLNNSILYTTLLPCYDCAKAIAQCGISEVVYCSDIANGNFKFDLTKKLFKELNIKLREYKGSIDIYFNGGN